LKDKTIGMVQSNPTDPDYLFVTTLLRFVGFGPEVKLKAFPDNTIMTALKDGVTDAVVAFPPLSQQLRTLGIGKVILNSIRDQPFANYLCCLMILRPEFIEKYPVATKRALRAIYRAADFCARDPEAAAAKLVADGFATNPVYALETVSMGRYGQWRDYDPEETMRFYALRLREAGMISSDPESLIKAYTDWRFHEALKKRDGIRPAGP
jgi:NitT/TauT family transport system substrate-binding protein